MARPGPLKLRARDAEDLKVFAAMLQDALVRPADITYLARERRFVMVVNRFRWERPDTDPSASPAAPDGDDDGVQGDRQEDARFADAGPRPLYDRVNAGVCFDRVKRVRTRNLDPRRKDQLLSLLTLHVVPGAVTLVFSDDALIRLDLAGVACHMEDLGEPWPTPWRPFHEAVRRPEGGG